MSMVFCRGCAKQIHESAVSCPGCGATQNSGGASASAQQASHITFGNVFGTVMKQYATFTGRARRKEYWLFVLVANLIAFVIGFIEGLIGLPGFASLLFSLAVMVPGIAVGVRRMHDTDRSGWWLLVPFANLVFLCLDSTPGENRFGQNPKGL